MKIIFVILHNNMYYIIIRSKILVLPDNKMCTFVSANAMLRHLEVLYIYIFLFNIYPYMGEFQLHMYKVHFSRIRENVSVIQPKRHELSLYSQPSDLPAVYGISACNYVLVSGKNECPYY